MASASLVHPNRIKTLHESPKKKAGCASEEGGTVVYWVTKNMRVENNWALIHAQEIAHKEGKPLVAMYTLLNSFPRCTERQYHFMLGGVASVRDKLAELNIPFAMPMGDMVKNTSGFIMKMKATTVVMDHDVVRLSAGWKDDVLKQLPESVSQYVVDSTNVVPVWEASDKCEESLAAFREKITPKIKEYLQPYPALQKQKHELPKRLYSTMVPRWGPINVDDVLKTWYKDLDTSVARCSWVQAGDDCAAKTLETFVADELHAFHKDQDQGNATLGMECHLFFGQISSQAIALAVEPHRAKHPKSVAAFLDRLIVQRELAMNNMQYDQTTGADESSLYPSLQNIEVSEDHTSTATYTRSQLENACTGEPIWNAIQKQMVFKGKMYGFLRTYWARKILEWSESPEAAFATAMYLMNKYMIAFRSAFGHSQIKRAMFVRSESTNVQDVQSRLQSALAEISQLRAQLSQAEKSSARSAATASQPITG